MELRFIDALEDLEHRWAWPKSKRLQRRAELGPALWGPADPEPKIGWLALKEEEVGQPVAARSGQWAVERSEYSPRRAQRPAFPAREPKVELEPLPRHACWISEA